MASSDNFGKQSRAISSARKGLLILAVILLALVAGGSIAMAQGQPVIEISGSDTSEFPIIELIFRAVDADGNRMDILPGLAVNEDGKTVEILDQDEVMVGFEYIFVIDANENYEVRDQADGLTRREIVRENILDFANNFMNQTQLDRVSIIVPGEEGGTVLVDRSRFHTELINEINFYEPEDPTETPLNAMLQLALDRAEESHGEGKGQAIVLFTDAAQLGDQLDYPALITRAQQLGVSIYSVVVNARADDEDFENVSQLGEPTGGSFVQMEIITSTQPIYTTLANNSVQTMLHYKSQINSAGDHNVTVQTTVAEGSTTINVDIAPAAVEMAVDNSLPIRRVLASVEDSLEDAEPKVQPIVARVSWPDGHPREVVEAALLVDGSVENVIDNPELDANNLITVDWDLTEVDDGVYPLVLRVTDELGMEGASAELPMTIEVARPEPPPEPETEVQPTAVPVVEEDSGGGGLIDDLGVVGFVVAGAALLALIIVIILAIVLLRRRRSPAAAAPMPMYGPDSGDATQVMMPAFAAPHAPTAYLEPLENAPEHRNMIMLSGDNIAIGRDENLAQIVFTNKSVSRLHARIMSRGGAFQIYDEGSASGTYVNYEQVSLTPQNVKDGDDIHFGQVHVRFHMSAGAQDDDATQIMKAPQRPGRAPRQQQPADDLSTQPYMPNQPAAPSYEPPRDDDEDDISTQPYMPHSPRR